MGELKQEQLEQARIAMPPGVQATKTFNHVFVSDMMKQMEIDEILLPTADGYKLCWCKRPFQQTVVGGFASPCFWKDLKEGGLVQAHVAVREAFEAYWNKPMTLEEYLEKAGQNDDQCNK